MTWTRFFDMYSGGDRKEAVELIYIEAAEDAARSVFYSRFGHNPDRVTCTCCGADYSITEYPSLAEATAYQRQQRTLDEYRRDPNAVFIEAADIAPAELREAVPAQGYVWMGDDDGSAEARLLAYVALAATALWVCYLAPLAAALLLLPATVVSAMVLVLLLRADRRRERVERDRDVVRSLARPLPPLTREQREAWERLRGQEWTT